MMWFGGGYIIVFVDFVLRCLVEIYVVSCEERNEEFLVKRIKNDKIEKEINILVKEGNEKNVLEKWIFVVGIVIVFCCYYRCDWRYYVGKEYFKVLGFGVVEFYYFQRMSSWVICGMRKIFLEVLNSILVRKDNQNDDSEEYDDGRYRIIEDSVESLFG